MVAIPKSNRLKDIIELQLIEEELRPYIGMSDLGHKCQRKIWYDFRWAYIPKFTPRQLRIFERGDMEEQRVISTLIENDMEVISIQDEIVDETGHIKGHIDGLVCNVPGAEKTKHLLEIKTMNDKRFNEYAKQENLETTNFPYYVQINQYMGRLGLSRCLFIVTNKNNEERIYSRIHFDKDNFTEYKEIGFDILTAEYPPKRIGSRVWYECKFCNAKQICHFNESIEKSCRSCLHVSIEQNGAWHCSLHNTILPEATQRVGCDNYMLDEMFNA